MGRVPRCISVRDAGSVPRPALLLTLERNHMPPTKVAIQEKPASQEKPKKFILFSKDRPEEIDPKEFIEKYKVDPEECLIMKPRTSLGEYPGHLKVLVWSHTDTWKLEYCPTVDTVMTKRRAAVKPAAETAQKELSEGKNEATT